MSTVHPDDPAPGAFGGRPDDPLPGEDPADDPSPDDPSPDDLSPDDLSPDDLPAADSRSGPTVLRMLLGTQLRRLREDAKITPDQAGYEIRGSRSKISRLEHGRVSFKQRDVGDLLTLYGVTDEQKRAGLLKLAEQANEQGWWSKFSDILPDWFEAYLGLEAAAMLIRSFELQFVHGLFQTEAYARAVTVLGYKSSPQEEIDRRVSLRMKRQDLLASGDAPRVWSVMDEAALRRPVGGPQVMRRQLKRLIEAADLPRVTMQVVPFRRGGHAGAGGSFTVLRFRQADLPDVAYIEQLTSALYLEKRSDVDHYLEVMNRLSAEALTPADTTRFLREIIRET
jgi:transcriptional regulator with XRE-family HTH domain